MERLTKRNDSNITELMKCGCKLCPTVCDESLSCIDCPIQESLDKLAAYEDAEEQGLLIKLQYPLGTELYFPFKCQGIIKDRIRRWQLNKNGLFFCSYAGNAYRLEAIGKTVFLTREEAEAALERIG